MSGADGTGALPEGWAMRTLGEVANWSSGGTPRAGTPEYYGGEIPWAVIGDLTDGAVGPTASTLTREGLAMSTAKVVPEGTVLVAMYGSIGKLGVASRPMATNQAIACAIPKLNVNTDYFFLWLQAQRGDLTAAGKGGTQQNISQTVLRAWPGMISVRAGEGAEAPRLLDLLIEEFEGFGYGVLEPAVLNAYHFGVPQDRRRMILMGWRTGEAEPAYPQPQTRGRTRRSAPAANKSDYDEGLPLCPTLWEAIGDLPDLDAFAESARGDEIPLSDADHDAMQQRATPYARIMAGIDDDPADLGYRRRWDPACMTSSRRTTHDPDVAARFAATAPGCVEPVSRFFRLHPDGVSPTLRAGTHYERGSFNAPRPIHPVFPRVISVREAARLHSFPDWFRLHWTKWHGFREVGNALPPRLARAVAAQIVTAVGAGTTRPPRDIDLGDQELLFLENIPAAQRFGADPTRIPRNALRQRVPATPAAA